MRPRLTLEEYTSGILSQDRITLAQAITLIESNRPKDINLAHRLLDHILPYTGNSLRIGVTGAPGVGKSSFIESFGNYITAKNKKLAVLSIDPSSQLSKGSILGDKTRMELLTRNPNAFIRPSPSGDALGGVSNKTRETILLCEAAGFDTIIVETVGVGQSEISVKGMVDFFLLLMLAGAGDELQGIKRGIMEMADAIAITKADDQNIARAKEAQATYQHALHLFSPSASGWITKVLTCSSVTGYGIDEIWEMILQYQQTATDSGYFAENRKQQLITWFQDYFEQLIKLELMRYADLEHRLNALGQKVKDNQLTPSAAAHQLLDSYHKMIKDRIS